MHRHFANPASTVDQTTALSRPSCSAVHERNLPRPGEQSRDTSLGERSRDLPTFLIPLVRRGVCSQSPHQTPSNATSEPPSNCSTVISSPPSRNRTPSPRDTTPHRYHVQVLAQGRPSWHSAPLCMFKRVSRGVMRAPLIRLL